MKFKIRLAENKYSSKKRQPFIKVSSKKGRNTDNISALLGISFLYKSILLDRIKRHIEPLILDIKDLDNTKEDKIDTWNKRSQLKKQLDEIKKMFYLITEFEKTLSSNQENLSVGSVVKKLQKVVEPIVSEYSSSVTPKSSASFDKKYGLSNLGFQDLQQDYEDVVFGKKTELDKDLESGWGDSDIDFESEDWSDFDDNEDIEIETPSSWDVDDEDIEFGEPEKISKDKLEQDRKNQELRKMARELSTFKDTVRDKIRIKQKKQTNPQALTKDTIDDKKEKARQQSNADRIIKRTRKEY